MLTCSLVYHPSLSPHLLHLTAGLAAYILANEHPHHRPKVEYPYMSYKVKDFPWGPNPLIGCPEEH